MTYYQPARLFTDEEIRAGYQRELATRRAIRVYLDERIAPQVSELRAAFERERMKIRAGMAAELAAIDDPCKYATVKAAGRELERMIGLCGENRATESQQRIVVAAREHPERILSMLEASFEAPEVNRFWRHHAKTHQGNANVPLGAAGHGLLRQLVRDYFETIPDIADLRGKHDHGR